MEKRRYAALFDDMLPSDELYNLALPDGGSIRADVSYRAGIRVARFDAELRELVSIELAYPSAGFGGGGWVHSPSGRLLILHYYSGQSEEAFILLDLSNGGLRVVASPGYHVGESASYAFSHGEDKMIMALPRSCIEWWAPWEDDGLEVAADGARVLRFATLLLCATDSGQMQRTEIELVPSVAQPIRKHKCDLGLAPDFFVDLELSIQLPWARIKIDLSDAPLRVRIPYPAQSAG